MLDAKTIKEQMTQGEWEIGAMDHCNIYGGDEEDHFLGNMSSDYGTVDTDEANAAAICNAVNGTYGKGINPEKVPEIYAMLERLVSSQHIMTDTSEIKALLTAAKL